LEGNGAGNIALAVVAFIISAILGVLVGILCRKIVRVGAGALGGLGGFFLGFTLYNLVLHFTQNIYILSVLTFGLAAFGAWFCYHYYHKILIFLTAGVGSYVLVRGIAIFAGNYPNEATIYSQLKNGVKPQFDNYFYMYFGLIIFFFLAGTFYQRRKLHLHGDEYHKHY
jgi:hypothetical protein